ncbi:MAG: hypothetical protein D6674_04790 [Acidobacteria bacterium]|nr:MAG: hypothetical protein D6674_04790 [Acidobacteriota bacterium]
MSNCLYIGGNEVLIVGNSDAVEETVKAIYVSIGQRPTGDLFYSYRLAEIQTIIRNTENHTIYPTGFL